jgi:hypothetical protein
MHFSLCIVFLWLFSILPGTFSIEKYSFTLFSTGWMASNFLNQITRDLHTDPDFFSDSYHFEASKGTVHVENISSFGLYFGSNLDPHPVVEKINGTGQNITLDGLKISLGTHFSIKWKEFSDSTSDGNALGSIVYTVTAESNFDLANEITSKITLAPNCSSFITNNMSQGVRSALSEAFLGIAQGVLRRKYEQLLQSAVDAELKLVSGQIKESKSTFLNGQEFSIEWNCEAKVSDDSSVLVSCPIALNSEEHKTAMNNLQVIPDPQTQTDFNRPKSFPESKGKYGIQGEIYSVYFDLSLIGKLQELMFGSSISSEFQFRQEDYASSTTVFDFQLIDFEVYNESITSWGSLRTKLDLNCSLDAVKTPEFFQKESGEISGLFYQNWSCIVVPIFSQNTTFPSLMVPLALETSLISTLSDGFELFVKSSNVTDFLEASFLDPEASNALRSLMVLVANRTTTDLLTSKRLSGFQNTLPIFREFTCRKPRNETKIENQMVVITFSC